MHVYIFATPSAIKIGSTAHLAKRLYQLQWGPLPHYAPGDAHLGNYAATYSMDTIVSARRAERELQSVLAGYRFANGARNNSGGQPEWFHAPVELALAELYTVMRRFVAL